MCVCLSMCLCAHGIWMAHFKNFFQYLSVFCLYLFPPILLYSESGLVQTLFTFMTVLTIFSINCCCNEWQFSGSKQPWSDSGSLFLKTKLVYLCVCVDWGWLKLPLLLIIGLCEASGKGLWPLWESTAMITSDLQPSAFLIMTVGLPPLPHLLLPPLSFHPYPTLLLLAAFLFFFVFLYFFFKPSQTWNQHNRGLRRELLTGALWCSVLRRLASGNVVNVVMRSC